MLKGYEKSIKAEGQVYYSPYEGKIVNNINYSDIFSELIQAAGMGCEYYASDMFIELKSIEKDMENCENSVRFIGIRDSGVDGNTFIECRLRNSATYGTNNYIKLYRLEIICNDRDIIMELSRTSELEAKKELCKEENV